MSINMEYIRAQLQRRAGERQLSRIAGHTGVTVRTLQRLAKGQSGTVSNAQAVQDFLLRTEKQAKIERAEDE
jgi:hypothetical protein